MKPVVPWHRHFNDRTRKWGGGEELANHLQHFCSTNFGCMWKGGNTMNQTQRPSTAPWFAGLREPVKKASDERSLLCWLSSRTLTLSSQILNTYDLGKVPKKGRIDTHKHALIASCLGPSTLDLQRMAIYFRNGCSFLLSSFVLPLGCIWPYAMRVPLVLVYDLQGDMCSWTTQTKCEPFTCGLASWWWQQQQQQQQ